MTQQKAVKLFLSSSNLNLIHSFAHITHSHAHSIHTLTADPECTVRPTHLLCMFTNKFNLFPTHKPNIYSCSDMGPEWWESISAVPFSPRFLFILAHSHSCLYRVCLDRHWHRIKKTYPHLYQLEHCIKPEHKGAAFRHSYSILASICFILYEVITSEGEYLTKSVKK